MQRSIAEVLSGRVGALRRRLTGGRLRELPPAVDVAVEALRRRCRVRVRENGSVEVVITVLKAPNVGRRRDARSGDTR